MAVFFISDRNNIFQSATEAERKFIRINGEGLLH